jgi:hypothetical protein
MVIAAYDPIIAEASRRFNVPEDRIRAVLQTESGGQPWARSPKGAGGLMQVMPGTYTDLAKRHGFGPDRFDPRNNIFAGTAYLGEMYDQFGNWDEATQAYNMGPGRAMRVRNGTATVPAETAAYLPKVQALVSTFGGNQKQGGDVAPGLMRPRPGQTTGMGPVFGGPRVGSLTGLLEADEDKNFYDGLGGLLNVGQTEQQPPRTDPAALPGSSQTDRMDLSGRINELIGQYVKQPPVEMPSQLQYLLAGAQKGMAGLTGVHDRPVGIGEMLGALGGGVTSGGLAYDEAAQQRQGSELDRLLKAGTYQNQQRATEMNAQNSEIDNVYKQALTQKALKPESDAERYKVVGKHVYDTQTKQFLASPEAAAGGAFEGNAAEVQAINELVRTGKITKEQGALWLASKTATGANGQVDVINPLAVPGGGTAPPTQTPNAAAPGPTVAAPPPANPGVTTVRPPALKDLPAPVQNNLLENVNALRTVEDALKAVTATPGATGPGVGMANQVLPGDSLNWFQPDGAKARAAIADIGSMKIHDRSGAAVTVSEFPRLKPFIPQVSDNAATVQMKLERFQQELANEIRDQAAMYGADQGYRGNPILDGVIKTGRAPRYEAPMSGGSASAGSPNVMRFDAKGNPIK